jgi:fido (protein-threonine AMPylation protein)
MVDHHYPSGTPNHPLLFPEVRHIHPFPNGNGRHARLVADVLATNLGRPLFTWGSAKLIKEGEARMKYLEAIKAADNGDIQLLLKFARS